MSIKGGARPGAGRPKSREVHESAVRKAEKKIRDRLPQLIDNLLTLADGVTVEDATAEGETVVYRKPPCRQTNEYLVSRILGKPTEKVETDNSGGLTVRVVYGTDNHATDLSSGTDGSVEEPEEI